MPFRYGIVTMTHLPHAFLRATVEIDGQVATGIAADHLPPKWFTKDPTRAPSDEILDMLRVIHHAMENAEGVAGPSVFALWNDLYSRQATWAAQQGIPPLLANFGTSLVERAMLDAYARHCGMPFHRLLQTDALGLDLGLFHPELAGSRASDWLPAAPLAKVFARHTVGLTDPLTKGDIPAVDRLADGLPQSLEECISAYGLRHFKIKIGGNAAADVARLETIAALLERHAPSDYRFSLDGNENFSAVAAFQDFLEGMMTRPALRGFWRHLLFIEQPLHRALALSDEVGIAFKGWPERPPMIIDESDADIGSLRTALRLGYAGTSHKNCKGIFKGIANACRVEQLRREHPERTLIMSGEDLSNIGPVALLQDLAVQAAIGVRSVERNGHHYFSGLSFWPASWQADMLKFHGDLYVKSEAGWPRVDVRGGELSLDSVNAAPFGLHFLPEGVNPAAHCPMIDD